jgi:hypothetical protein
MMTYSASFSDYLKNTGVIILEFFQRLKKKYANLWNLNFGYVYMWKLLFQL